MAGRTHDQDRLDGWKAIAAFMGRDERTLMRWEAARGLPIRRMPGDGKASVFAYRADLAAWVAGAPRPGEDAPAVVPTPAPVAPRSAPRVRSARRTLGAVALTGAVVAGIFLGRPGEHLRSVAHSPADPKAQALYLQGRYLWDRRTPGSLENAAAAFGAAIARDPRYAAAYAGLADCYLLMREFGTMTDAQAFPRANAAANAALALDPGLAAAARARAFVRFWWQQDRAGGLADFRAAVALAPGDAQTHHWYATALAASGDRVNALAQIETARGLDPVSTAILSDRGLILFQAGRTPEAEAALTEIVASEPGQTAARIYLAQVLLARGDAAGFLREQLAAASLRGDAIGHAIFAPGVAKLRVNGPGAMLAAVAGRAERAARDGRYSAYAAAALAGMAGENARAGPLLTLARARREPSVMAAGADPWLKDVESPDGRGP